LEEARDRRPERGQGRGGVLLIRSEICDEATPISFLDGDGPEKAGLSSMDLVELA